MTFVELGFGVHPLQGVYRQNPADGAVEADMAFHAVKPKKSYRKDNQLVRAPWAYWRQNEKGKRRADRQAASDYLLPRIQSETEN
ncbi:hypothetical protein ACFHWW_23130 [Ensifer sp. P24N7]|uniref:hypothetical protein n=1 Tax=Sinorhizobium sp. P24N7 TaxID=3348358 RepID=UPI0035F27734